MDKPEFSRRQLLKGATLAMTSALFLDSGSRDSSKLEAWKDFLKSPENQQKVQTIEMAKKHVESLGLQIPRSGFFDVQTPPSVNTFIEANEYVGVCAAPQDAVQLPGENKKEGVGCFKINSKLVNKYDAEYFFPKGLDTYRYSASANSVGRLSYEFLELSNSHIAIGVFHESIHKHLEAKRSKLQSPFIEEPAAELFALRVLKQFALMNPGLIHPAEMEAQLTARTQLYELTNNIAHKVQDANETKSVVSSIMEEYRDRLSEISTNVKVVDPKLAELLTGFDTRYNTARLQRHIPYAYHFEDIKKLYESFASPQEFVRFLETLNPDYKTAIKQVKKRIFA